MGGTSGGELGPMGIPQNQVIEVEKIIEVKDEKMLKQLEEKLKKEKHDLRH